MDVKLKRKISYESARAAKQLGFNLPTTHYYKGIGPPQESSEERNWNQDFQYWSAPDLITIIMWIRNHCHYEIQFDAQEQEILKVLLDLRRKKFGNIN